MATGKIEAQGIMTKDEAARNLIDWHFRVEPDIVEVYRFLSPEEEAPDEPIKLLEVSEATLPTGRVDAFGFGPAEDFPYSTVVSEVTPEEMEKIKEGLIPLPAGWRLDSCVRIPAPQGSHAD